MNIEKSKLKGYLETAFNSGFVGCIDLRSDCVESILRQIENLEEDFSLYDIAKIRTFKVGTIIIHKNLGKGKVVKSGRMGHVLFEDGSAIGLGNGEYPWNEKIKIITETAE
jgi:hypothetical protein